MENETGKGRQGSRGARGAVDLCGPSPRCADTWVPAITLAEDFEGGAARCTSYI